MATPNVGDAGGLNGTSLWAKQPKAKMQMQEQAAGGMTASFAPNGANFAETIRSTFGTQGNNCGGI